MLEMLGDAGKKAWGKLRHPGGNLERRNDSCIIDKLYTGLDDLVRRVWPQATDPKMEVDPKMVKQSGNFSSLCVDGEVSILWRRQRPRKQMSDCCNKTAFVVGAAERQCQLYRMYGALFLYVNR